jgi:hypothetical protein
MCNIEHCPRGETEESPAASAWCVSKNTLRPLVMTHRVRSGMRKASQVLHHWHRFHWQLFSPQRPPSALLSSVSSLPVISDDAIATKLILKSSLLGLNPPSRSGSRHFGPRSHELALAAGLLSHRRGSHGHHKATHSRSAANAWWSRSAAKMQPERLAIVLPCGRTNSYYPGQSVLHQIGEPKRSDSS